MMESVSEILHGSCGKTVKKLDAIWKKLKDKKLLVTVAIGLTFILLPTQNGHTAVDSQGCGTFSSKDYIHGGHLIHGHAMGIFATGEEARAACIANHGRVSGGVHLNVWIPYMYSGEYFPGGPVYGYCYYRHAEYSAGRFEPDLYGYLAIKGPCVDNCPDDPDKTKPGVCGCGVPDLDSDGDSVFDCNDKCPNDPDKTEPGVCGCGVPDLDSDGDSVFNCKDNCPLTPGGCEVDSKGCAIDRDGDGNADCFEMCPDDPNSIAPGLCGCSPDPLGEGDDDGDGVIMCVDQCLDEAGNGPDGCINAARDVGVDNTQSQNETCRYYKGDPISILSGNHIEKETDLKTSSPFSDGFTFERFYNSRSSVQSALGEGWTHNYQLTFKKEQSTGSPILCEATCEFEDRDQLMDHYAGWTVIKETLPQGGSWGKVALCPGETCEDISDMQTATYCRPFEHLCPPHATDEIIIEDETGFSHYFRSDNGKITPLNGDHSSLTMEGGLYRWRRTDGTVAAFDPGTNQLVWLEDQNGNRRELIYDAESGNLIRITDNAGGRSLGFVYNDDLISAVHLYTGDTDQGPKVSYAYDENNNLTGVTYGDGSGFIYEYNDESENPDISARANNMTRKTNAAGHLLATWTYDEKDRCITNTTPDARGVSFEFSNGSSDVTVTDAYGVSRVYTFTYINGKRLIHTVEGINGCTTCLQEAVRMEYDANANVLEKEYANGRIDRFTNYDDRGNPGTVTQAADSPEERTFIYTWHPELNRPLSVSEPSVMGDGVKQTVWDYDDDGNETANENPGLNVHRIIQSGFTLNSAGELVPVTAVTRLQYDARGLLASMDGPLAGSADTTIFDYDPATGDMTGITAPVSGAVTFSGHDALGRPGRMTDAAGNTLAYTYDAAGRPATITRLWDNAVTRLTYTAAGKPATVTLPDGSTLTYQYDPVFGRLTGITDGLGNRVTHGYDDNGHVIETAYYATAGGRTFWQGFDYDYPQRPGKLWQEINADGNAYEYAYDNSGNLNQMTDPAGKITTYGFDLFNRSTSTTQSGGVTTELNYDSQGNLVLAIDPTGNTTEYRVDDLGRMVQTISPDSGVTTYAYNLAGNLVSKTDANQVTAVYSYDAQNRLTAIHYPDAAQNVALTYDNGLNAQGLLTGRSDAGGIFSYTYDAAGNITAETHTIDGVAFTTNYAYNTANQVTQMTYPDGRTVNYDRDSAGNITRITTLQSGVTTTLADNITHLPFGPAASMTLGNGLTVNRAYDQSYQLTENSADGILNQRLTRDAAGNVTAVDDSLDPLAALSLIYDDLYRLTSADGKFGSLSYSYDANSNRQTRTAGSETATTYQYTTGTNQLALITRDTITDVVSDAAGNTILYGELDLTYDAANRLSEVERDGVILGSYTYSADGRRVKKIANGQTTHFHYDLTGKLIAESDGQGVFTQLYIYLEDTPLALVVVKDKQDDKKKNKPVKQKQALKGTYFYHTDHLGTPRRITDRDGKLVWAADYLPFGQAVVTLEKVENNLRFPGQYFDSETGLHYNYFRYYDPALGRYLRVDPIGLEGGINPYVYVRNNPGNWVDPYGLYVKHLFEDKLPSWLRDDRSDSERESVHQEYNEDIGDRLKKVWGLAKIVTFFEKAVFWAPIHTTDKITGKNPHDSYFDPWHHRHEPDLEMLPLPDPPQPPPILPWDDDTKPCE